ncbi:hypothetical protein MFLO_02217 [Listeria floridensis FSL S10-1187]|uniref:Permease n=1 Tax=Listeria floridensis FSL S10-1187 TaxID=1265817 RepID=A0ABP3B126_9LIST|nr:membrane protein [Listeria floridensis]EUJ33568.1 hypothetical protein MFLO_02217 [Listeria floridensis FSL S10-1187]
MALLPLTLIILVGFIVTMLLFEFVVKWEWFKYFLATIGLIASGIIFFISFYGGGLKQTDIAIALFFASFGEYVVSLIVSLIRMIQRRKNQTAQTK